MEVMISHVRDEAPSLREIRANIPESLQSVIHKCLRKASADRYQIALEMRAALEACDLQDQWTQEDAATWWQEVMQLIAKKESEAK